MHCIHQGQGQIETPVRFLNFIFEARRRLRATSDSNQIEFMPRGHVEPIGLGSQLFAFYADRQGNYSSMAPTTRSSGCRMPSTSNPFSENGGGDYIGPGKFPSGRLEAETNPGWGQRLDLSFLGQGNPVFPPNQAGATSVYQAQRNHGQIVSIGHTGYINPQIFCPETYAQGPYSRGRSNNDPMAAGHFNSVGNCSTAFGNLAHCQRKQDWPADSHEVQANRPTKILACYGDSPPCSALVQKLLCTKLCNPHNLCCINGVLLRQLWAILATDVFYVNLW